MNFESKLRIRSCLALLYMDSNIYDQGSSLLLSRLRVFHDVDGIGYSWVMRFSADGLATTSTSCTKDFRSYQASDVVDDGIELPA